MKLSPWLVIVLILISGLLGFAVSLYQHKLDKPVPRSSSIQTFHYPAIFVAQLKHDPKAGQKIFTEFCASCHASSPLIDIRAPRIGDKKIWKSLSKIPLDTLLETTINGVGAMPARGGCFECSDEQLRQTIRYMLNEST